MLYKLKILILLRFMFSLLFLIGRSVPLKEDPTAIENPGSMKTSKTET